MNLMEDVLNVEVVQYLVAHVHAIQQGILFMMQKEILVKEEEFRHRVILMDLMKWQVDINSEKLQEIR